VSNWRKEKNFEGKLRLREARKRNLRGNIYAIVEWRKFGPWLQSGCSAGIPEKGNNKMVKGI
jgi:hypothetical protein